MLWPCASDRSRSCVSCPASKGPVLCGRSLHHSRCWAGLLLHPVDGLQRWDVKCGGCWVGQWGCQWQDWHVKLLRKGSWCRCWLGDDRVELRGCWLRQLLRLERMGIPHAREEAFLRSRGPQSRQSLALKSVWPSGRCRREQSSQRIHLLDPVAGKQAGGTSLNADVQLSFVVQSTHRSPLHSLALMSAAYDALPREGITEQEHGGSLRIQRQLQVTKALFPTCLSSSTCETSGSASSSSG